MNRPSAQLVQDQSLFTPESFSVVYPFVTTLTLGLLKLYRLDIKPDRVYLVDVGYNDVFIYDRESAKHSNKLFWKLNLANAPVMVAEGIQRGFDVIARAENIPSFDPKFGEKGSWITLDYSIRVSLELTRGSVGHLRHAVNPLTTVQNAAVKAARTFLPYTKYEEALIATAEQDIQKAIAEDKNVEATGLRVVLVDVENIKGSEKLSETMQQSFGRMLEASDQKEATLMFADMDRDTFQRGLERVAPTAALEYRARSANQMLEAMLASGLNPLQAYQKFGGMARMLEQKNPQEDIAVIVAQKAGELIKPSDWPPLVVPKTIGDHLARLKWERDQLEERVPIELQDAPSETSSTFLFKLSPEHELKVEWPTGDYGPVVHINQKVRTDDFASLKPDMYDKERVTIWDIYVEARKILGLDKSSEAAGY